MTNISENTLRRRLAKQGYALRKSRRRESVDNLGGYMIVDERNCVAAGERYDMTAADVLAFIEE